MPTRPANVCSSSRLSSLTRWLQRRPRYHQRGASISTVTSPQATRALRRAPYVGDVRDDERVVRAAWRSVGGGRAAHVADSVLARHREPHRRYHGVTHVAWVVRTVDELLPTVGAPGTVDAPVVRAAALFHDAVYDPRRADNEVASAQLAQRVLAEELGWPTARIDTVVRLILATAGHTLAPDDADTDPAAAVLLDADLGVLGTSPNVYQAYVDGVRGEYAHVDRAAWCAGRGAVLRAFLDRPWIYTTAAMRSTREARARANLEAELAGLTASGPVDRDPNADG